MRISKDRVNLDDKVLQKPKLKDYAETVVTTDSGTSYTIDLTEGNVFDITLTDNCTFTFSNPSPNGIACSFTLLLTQDSTGSRTVTWPSAVKWPSGTAPTLTATADNMDIYSFVTMDEGTNWFGATAAQAFNLSDYPTYLDYGYFGGGRVLIPVHRSTVDRIDYSNETATAVAKGPLSLARSELAASGNSSYGYFGGGYGPRRSTIDRIDYSNDTATAVAKGPLSTNTQYPGGLQNCPL